VVAIASGLGLVKNWHLQAVVFGTRTTSSVEIRYFLSNAFNRLLEWRNVGLPIGHV
jgi:hypothetical protein